MATYVLCAGGYTGGWIWRDIGVETTLREAGHLVFAPTYTGIGDRVHLTSPDIDLDTHVEDVRRVLEFEELSEVILVGWSYGGMVVAALAAQVPDRICHVVVVDGYVPEDGQSLADIVGPDVTSIFEANARTSGDGWRLIPDWDEPDQRSTSHPLATIHTPVSLDSLATAAIPRTFLACTENDPDDPILWFTDDASAKTLSDPTWSHRELPTDHGLTDTKLLVEILLDIGRSSSLLAT